MAGSSDSNVRLGWGERIGYGVGSTGWNMVNGIFGTFLVMYFTNVALLDVGFISVMLAVSRLFDGISDLVAGNIVDRTRSKFGKARVWLLRMCIPLAVSFNLDRDMAKLRAEKGIGA